MELRKEIERGKLPAQRRKTLGQMAIVRYGRWLNYLVRKGLLDNKPAADRITPAEVKRYIAELEQLSPLGCDLGRQYMDDPSLSGPHQNPCRSGI